MYLEGIEMVNNKKYEEGYKLLNRCASVGHGGCAEVLGWAYYSGEGIKEDFDAAVKWLKVAWQTGTNYGFAGLSGAVSIAEYYCDDVYFQKNSGDVDYWRQNAKTLLLQLLAQLKDGKLPEHDDIFKGMISRIAYLDKAINMKTCKSIERI